LVPLHNLLKRQLKRYLGVIDAIPEELQNFVGAVNDAYIQSDLDRLMVERSLELSSEELGDANSEMRAILHAFPDLYFRLTSEGKILDVKANKFDGLSLPPSELIGKQMQKVSSKVIGEKFAQGIAEVVQSRDSITLEYSMVVDSELKFFEARLLPLHHKEILAIIRNITDRKHSESKLRQAEAKYRTLVEHMPAITYYAELGMSGKWHYVSPQIETLLGFTAKEWMSNSGLWQSQVHPEDRTRVFMAEVNSMETGDPYRSEYRIFSGNGDVIWVRDEAAIVADEFGKNRFKHGVIFDISHTKVAEEALEESLSLLRATFESTADGILVVNLEGHVLDYNERFSSMWNIPSSVLAASDDAIILESVLQQVIHPEEFLAKVKELYAQPTRESFDVIKFKDGRSFERYSLPQRLGERIIGRVWSFRDITEKKRWEESLSAYASSLERSNRELQDFANIASHDLQEPLRKIQTFGDKLKQKYGPTLGDEGQDYLDRMANAANRMQHLITDLLAYSRVTTKGQPFVIVDIAKVTNEVLTDLEIRIQETKASFQIGDLPSIEADPLQIRQLLQNLIGNALKFNRPGQVPTIKIQANLVNGHCELFVEDNGIGFDEKYLDRIFGMFQRLHGRNSYEGTGVGLAICRKIVERHCGNITAKSTVGQGTQFIVTLPVQQKKAQYNAEQ